MNKQELIYKLERLLEMPSELEGYDFEYGHDFGIRRAIVLAKQLDDPARQPEPKPIEPKKPVVPQYVADMIIEKKKQYGIVDTIKNLGVFNNPFDLIVEKQLNWVVENQEDFVKAWLYGYEVEKEKLYTVEIPNPNGFIHLVLCKDCGGKIFVATFSGGKCWETYEKCKLTEAEIKKDFEWALQFKKEV